MLQRFLILLSHRIQGIGSHDLDSFIDTNWLIPKVRVSTEGGHEVCNYVLVIKEIEGLVGGLFS